MKVVALAGGVGGAKLADGLARSSSSPDLTVIVNTGDDFSLYGLKISPDLDTVCYTLAGIEGPETGWGRADETWETLEELQKLGGPDWFSLGNRDLATHLERTRRLSSGESLSRVTADFIQTWGVGAEVIPMSDDPIPTTVLTDQGELAFQEYFVRSACEPAVSGFTYQGAEHAQPAPGIVQAIKSADLIVICPSNPWVSIGPILAVPGIRSALEEGTVMAISPIIGGKAVKGPAAKMYREMGISPSAAAVAHHYGELLDGFVIDEQDHQLLSEIEGISAKSLKVLCTDTWMKTREDRVRLADEVLNFGQR
ncbi:MAG: 2-phospho-L-lactate transferase [Anaerolineales bacterium]